MHSSKRGTVVALAERGLNDNGTRSNASYSISTNQESSILGKDNYFISSKITYNRNLRQVLVLGPKIPTLDCGVYYF